MEILNTTTNKIEVLSLIDRKTGLDWAIDLIGTDLSYIDYTPVMNQESITWWRNTINGLNNIEDLKEEAKELLGEEKYSILENILNDEAEAGDYDLSIKILTQTLKDAIANA
jgi:hypothetical protein